MKGNYFLVAIFFFSVFISCKGKEKYAIKPFFDTHKKHVGDSIFINNLIGQIVFTDSSYEIDSIVFNRYDNLARTLESVKTFKNGKNIFENIDYYENGNIKRYSFIDEDSSDYYYERLYHSSGALLKINGYLFFQGYIIDTVSKNTDVKRGTTLCYRIYYPNPPDCKAKLYIKYDDSTLYDVFTRSKFLNFLQTVYQDNDKVGTFKTNVLLELRDKSRDTIVHYNQELIFRVIP